MLNKFMTLSSQCKSTLRQRIENLLKEEKDAAYLAVRKKFIRFLSCLPEILQQCLMTLSTRDEFSKNDMINEE